MFSLCGIFCAEEKEKDDEEKACNNIQVAKTTPAAAQPAVDTTKKEVAAAPAKPFDRPMDGYYKKTNILSAKVTPYPNLREADVAYAKRVWREIDTRDKMNQYLVIAKTRLIDILMDAIAAGELTAYDATPTPKRPGR